MIKILTFVIAFCGLSMGAEAACLGNSGYTNCYDHGSGNNYSISRFGNTTQLYGSNSRTGSQWDQTSSTYGNTTFQSGTAANGRSWNQTSTRIGDTTFYSGTDSNGEAFSGSTSPFGTFDW